MKQLESYYLVNECVLPEVFKKVIEAKKILQSNNSCTVNDTVKKVGISRSTFYKYKDYVYLYSEVLQEKIITLFFVLEDVPGILSEILNIIAKFKANILTINQNIPINKMANLTISLRTKNIVGSVEELIERLNKIQGVKNIKIIS